MSTRTELRRTHLSPRLAAILGLLLLAANIAVDVSTGRGFVQAEAFTSQSTGQNG